MDKKKVITNYMNDGFVIKNNDGDDEIIHIPYNLNNVLVNESDIIQILAQYNVNIDKINHIEYTGVQWFWILPLCNPSVPTVFIV